VKCAKAVVERRCIERNDEEDSIKRIGGGGGRER